MRLLVSSLPSTEGGGGIDPTIPQEISELSIVLTGGLQTQIETVYWFRTYLTSDFPELIEMTKKYFFIYSTHHRVGGCWWGQGDELDLSDFVQGARLELEGNSEETPTLFRIPTGEGIDDKELMLIYHPWDTPQQTRAYRNAQLTNLSLSNMGGNGQWTYINDLTGPGYDPDKILGFHTLANGNQLRGIDEGHTGYASFRNRGYKDFEIRHMALGKTAGNNPTGNQFHRYSYSSDGFNWTRGEDFTYEYINGERWTLAAAAKSPYFTIGGKHYVLGIIRTGPTIERNQPCPIIQYDENYRNGKIIKYIGINCDDAYTRQEGNLLHIYFLDTREHPNHLVYSTLDITNIDKWDLPDLTDVEPVQGVILDDWVKAKDTEPPVLTNALTFSNVTNKSVDLSITGTDNDEIIGYDTFVAQAPNPTEYHQMLRGEILDNTEMTRIYSGNTYYVRVKAVDRIGNRSDYSNEITFTTL